MFFKFHILTFFFMGFGLFYRWHSIIYLLAMRSKHILIVPTTRIGLYAVTDSYIIGTVIYTYNIFINRTALSHSSIILFILSRGI